METAQPLAVLHDASREGGTDAAHLDQPVRVGGVDLYDRFGMSGGSLSVPGPCRVLFPERQGAFTLSERSLQKGVRQQDVGLPALEQFRGDDMHFPEIAFCTEATSFILITMDRGSLALAESERDPLFDGKVVRIEREQ